MARAGLIERERSFARLIEERDREALLDAYRRAVIDLQVRAATMSLAARLLADELRALGGG